MGAARQAEGTHPARVITRQQCTARHGRLPPARAVGLESTAYLTGRVSFPSAVKHDGLPQIVLRCIRIYLP